jgi:phage internal scaffolding protein
MTKIASAYKGTIRVQKSFHDEEGNHDGKTEQHHKDLCDVKNIIHQYDRTGLITHVAKAKAEYGDYTEANEYQDAMNIVVKSQEAFMELPAKIRAKFGNDPGQFFEFATDPKNMKEMVNLGLAVEQKPDEVPTVRVLKDEKEPAETAE